MNARSFVNVFAAALSTVITAAIFGLVIVLPEESALWTPTVQTAGSDMA